MVIFLSKIQQSSFIWPTCEKSGKPHSVALPKVFNHETYLALRSCKLHTLTKYFVKT